MTDSADPEKRSHEGRRCLVTGGAGFIGSHLVGLLVQQGNSVTVVDDLSTGNTDNLAPFGSVRLIDTTVGAAIPLLAAEEPFERVFHLAAAVGVDLVLEDPVSAIETNVEQTSALLKHLAGHGAPATLVASSSEVYGKPGTSVFSEEDDTLLGPTTISRWSYAHAKAIDEHLALGYHSHRGLPTVVARFFNTVGPRQQGRYGMVLPRFVEAALAGDVLRVFGDGSQSRCFCDVRDVAPALPRLLEDPANHGRVFNVGSDHPVTIAELAEMVIRVLGSDSGIVLTPYEDAYPAGFEDLRQRRPDLARIREAIGFEATISIERTITDIASAMNDEARSAGGSR